MQRVCLEFSWVFIGYETLPQGVWKEFEGFNMMLKGFSGILNGFSRMLKDINEILKGVG